VPVKIRSPGSSVQKRERYATSSGTAKIMSLVRAACIDSPATSHVSARSFGSVKASRGTIAGPIGPNVLIDLPRENCGGRSLNCRRRSEMSWPIV